MTASTTLIGRNQAPLDETWDLESVFATQTDWETACKNLENQLPCLAAYQNRLSESPQILLEFLNIWQEAGRLMGKLSDSQPGGS